MTKSRLYRGCRTDGDAQVTVDGAFLDPRNDICNHSPDGFEWGYWGSGPAQLALAILADHLKYHSEDIDIIRPRVMTPWLESLDITGWPVSNSGELPTTWPSTWTLSDFWAERMHQLFKARLARIDESTWEMRTEEVTQTLEALAKFLSP